MHTPPSYIFVVDALALVVDVVVVVVVVVVFGFERVIGKDSTP
jgi:hypothetical protein